MKTSGADAPAAIALNIVCLLPRPPCCGPCYRPKTSWRKLTSLPTLKVLSCRSSAFRCLHQTCGHCAGCCDQRFPLGGALSHTSTRCASPPSTTAVAPAAMVVVATPTIVAATSEVTTPNGTVATATTVAASLFAPVAFRQLLLRGSARRRDWAHRREPSAGP